MAFRPGMPPARRRLGLTDPGALLTGPTLY